jgi:hypothetical protein
MFLREPGDAGLSSRNPAYSGRPEATISYVLSNGQVDSYPASWALPIATVERALQFFRTEGRAPPFISWHDDTSDGSHIQAGPNYLVKDSRESARDLQICILWRGAHLPR